MNVAASRPPPASSSSALVALAACSPSGRSLDPGAVDWGTVSFVLVLALVAVGVAAYGRRATAAHELSLVAALAALATASRVLFASLPNVKPVTFVVLISGVALGPGPGFMVGATSALVSNLFFGQGPWTPWQMLAWGAVGAAGGLIGRGGRLPRRWELVVAGGLLALAFDWFVTLWMFLAYTRADPGRRSSRSTRRACRSTSRTSPRPACLLVYSACRLLPLWLGSVSGPASPSWDWRTHHDEDIPAGAAAGLRSLCGLLLRHGGAGAGRRQRAPRRSPRRSTTSTRDRRPPAASSTSASDSPNTTPWAILAIVAGQEKPDGLEQGRQGPDRLPPVAEPRERRALGRARIPPAYYAKTILAYTAALKNDLIIQNAGHAAQSTCWRSC